MALRNLLLVIAFLISFKYFWIALLKNPKPLLPAVLLIVILQVWMLIIAGLISKHPLASFSEWVGQWLPVIMVFVIGIGLAYALMQTKLRDPHVIVVMIILVPITLFLFVNAIALIYDSVLTGKFLREQHQLGITDQKSITSYLIALLEPILIADMFNRSVKRNTLIPLHSWVIPAVLLLAIFCLIAASSRNGLLFMILAFILGAAMMFSEIRKIYSLQRIITFISTTLIFLFAFVLISYKTDPRWQNFAETVPIAWDIDHDLLWLSSDYSNLPLTPSGDQVELSAYNRIAWAHEGWRMLIEHPWGTEISRYTFRNLELAKYGQAGMWHSHNSWIDFGLNVGFPGLFLWIAFFVLLIRNGWHAWQRQKEPLGLALVILVIMFALRGLFDSIFRDHMTPQFMLVAGLLIGAISFPHHDETKDAPAK